MIHIWLKHPLNKVTETKTLKSIFSGLKYVFTSNILATVNLKHARTSITEVRQQVSCANQMLLKAEEYFLFILNIIICDLSDRVRYNMKKEYVYS